ncbi:hypothetical protein ABPG72_019556 [Tetrahymena utriculariae]
MSKSGTVCCFKMCLLRDSIKDIQLVQYISANQSDQSYHLYKELQKQKVSNNKIKSLCQEFIFTNSQQYVSFLYSEYNKPYDSLTEQQLRILTFLFSMIIPINGITRAHIKNKGKNKIKIYQYYSNVQHLRVTSAVRYQVPPISLQDTIQTNPEIMFGYKNINIKIIPENFKKIHEIILIILDMQKLEQNSFTVNCKMQQIFNYLNLVQQKNHFNQLREE